MENIWHNPESAKMMPKWVFRQEGSSTEQRTMHYPYWEQKDKHSTLHNIDIKIFTHYLVTEQWRLPDGYNIISAS